MGRIQEKRVAELLGNLIYDHEKELCSDLCDGAPEIEVSDIRVQTYEEAGVLTKNEGLVVTFRPTGQKFQITIVEATR